MASKKELKRQLFERIGEELLKLGFKPVAKIRSFRRKMPFGVQSFHLSIINHTDDFDVTADVDVGFDALYSLLSDANGISKSSDKSGALLFGAEIGNIESGRQKRWTCSGAADLPHVVSQILSSFFLVGLPYLEKYSDMEAALNVLAEDDRKAWLHMPIHYERARLAIGLCFLLGDKERFLKVAEKKRVFLESRRNAADLSKFLEFREKLESRFPRN